VLVDERIHGDRGGQGGDCAHKTLLVKASHGCCSTGVSVTPDAPCRNRNRFESGQIGNVDGATNDDNLKEIRMGIDDKIENKAEDLGGKAKEGAGKATDDEDLEAEGKTDQTKSSLKDAKENVKDAFS
jgi:uncharacterized protein YjbJ (UPF0337 family)